MEYEKTPLIIEIKLPQKNHLNPEELVKYRNIEIEPLRVGAKRTKFAGSHEEAEDLIRLQEQLKRQISVERVERLTGRTYAEWDEPEQAVCVTRKDGKFESFGHSRDGKYYLEYFEALFLLELGRLQLQHQKRIVSIEQAYILLLGEEVTIKFHEYLLYSNFMRVGYILVKHRNIPRTKESSSYDCIWALLLHALHMKPISNAIVKSPHYSKVKQSMEQIKQNIQKQTESDDLLTPSEDSSSPPSIAFNRKMLIDRKRKGPLSAEWSTNRYIKRSCCHNLSTDQSYLDFLKNEPEYKKFRNIFQKFDIVKLDSRLAKTNLITCHHPQLQIQFDVHLHNDGFKKSAPKPPIFRLILLECNAAFPTNAQIAQCYERQHLKVPLLVASVDESKHIQAFLYFFK